MKNLKTITDEHINFDGNYVNLPVAFTYNKIMHEQYEFYEFENRPYIIARKPKIDKEKIHNGMYTLGHATRPINCKNCDLLFSLLKLREKIIQTKSVRINDKNIQLIIEWCKSQGLPFQGRLRDINRALIDDLYKEKQLLGFSIEDFMLNLTTIQNAFSMYLVVKGIDKPNNISGLNYEECKYYLKHNFERLELVTRFNFEKFEYVSVADNLFQAAMYQLMLLTTINRNKDGALVELAICKCCHSPFMQHRRNQKYCPECSPQKAYKRKKSAKRGKNL